MQLVEQHPDFPPDQHAVFIVVTREGFDARINETSRFAPMLPIYLKGTGPEMMSVIHVASIYRYFFAVLDRTNHEQTRPGMESPMIFLDGSLLFGCAALVTSISALIWSLRRRA
jgi:hypothetical protein